MARCDAFVEAPPERVFRMLSGAAEGAQLSNVLAPVHLTRSDRLGPVLGTRVTYELQPHDGGTRVSLVEDLAVPLGGLIMGPIGHGIVRARNAAALRQLKRALESGQPGSEA